MAEITPEMLSQYISGQVEIQNQRGNYLFRGEIAAIGLIDNDGIPEVSVTFAWMKEMVNWKWVTCAIRPYKASLGLYNTHLVSGKIILSSPITGEKATIFPPDGSKIKP